MYHQSNTAAALQFPYNAMSVEAVTALYLAVKLTARFIGMRILLRERIYG